MHPHPGLIPTPCHPTDLACCHIFVTPANNRCPCSHPPIPSPPLLPRKFPMTQQSAPGGALRTIFLSILFGLLIGMIAANIWPIFLFRFSVPLATVAELIFLSVYAWWAAGGGPPRAWAAARANAFRNTSLTPAQWAWGLLAAIFFALTVHSAIVILFRFVPYPVALFRKGYDISFIPTVRLRLLACVISALSAGVCEEIGFRGYMQRPIEQRVGVKTAIAISSVLFMLIHLSKGWASLGMVPIVLGAGILLGLLAWSSRSLLPCII